MAARITAGSGVLLGRYGRWITADGPRAAASRVAGCGGAAALGVWTTAEHLPWLPLPAAAAWCAAAWAAAPEPDSADTEPEPEVFDPDQWLRIAHDAVGGARGVHLSALAAALTEALGEEWSTEDVRAAADELGVPVTASVRVGGRVSTGIRTADLPPPPPPLPDDKEGCSSAGHAATATTTPVVEKWAGGAATTIYPHGRQAAEPARPERRAD
ncbi:hypothetical protein [Streptomyces sp. YIM 98790]|uniref:hypothetical protein n=1 Tax=Streptomyces sp. YIM 98790 TaxID=2689077 RepID=UPI00140D7ADB|nr:hypothetical protein [Streptomyces sp. YIM 98790]